MSDAMVVDATASPITAWVGPMPHSVHQEPALSYLQRTYKPPASHQHISVANSCTSLTICKFG
ncbi:hypothetical protein BCR44DRAFT_58634 [Catenaria anguillulae PL171]|uniref:Uncharacterized protein n=1 Tax=Catenaria anguillulae PL171 TaxID=765915 RepID=A0A1Y2HBP7_9FUNG|nr:hypothetical protein BCR44DRAFT_58634 [Catenaria anguillulae PL171]